MIQLRNERAEWQQSQRRAFLVGETVELLPGNHERTCTILRRPPDSSATFVESMEESRISSLSFGALKGGLK